MGTEFKDVATHAFDLMTDSVRAGFETGRKAQEAWFEAWNGHAAADKGRDGMFAGVDRFAKAWAPFMAQNMQTAVECLEANCRAGLDVTRAACEVAGSADQSDFVQKSRRMWDAGFDAGRRQFEAFGQAAKSSADNWAALCNPTNGDAKSKPAAKTTKRHS